MITFPKPGQPGPGALVAPLGTDPAQWTRIDWHCRGDPDAPPVRIRTGDPAFPIPGAVVVNSYRDVFTDYPRHPEAKAAAPDGQPCRPDTRGLLQPLTITADTFTRIGKEANRLADTPDHITTDHDQPVHYPTRHCPGCTTPLTGRRTWRTDACRKKAARPSGPASG